MTSYDRWRTSKAPVKFGATGTDDLMLYGIPKIVHATLNLPVQVIGGYKGTADIRLAAEAGELAGACWGWESIKATWKKAIDSGEVNVVLQTVPQSHPDLATVPLAIDLTKTDEERRLIELGIHSVSAITRPYLLPPATPNDRVQILRKAFATTMKDEDFLAEIQRLKLEINPMTGEELETVVNRIFKMKPETLAKLKEALRMRSASDQVSFKCQPKLTGVCSRLILPCRFFPLRRSRWLGFFQWIERRSHGNGNSGAQPAAPNQALAHYWHPVARSSEVADKPVKAKLLNQPLVLWRSDGQVSAFYDLCFHRGTPLSFGWFETASSSVLIMAGVTGRRLLYAYSIAASGSADSG